MQLQAEKLQARFHLVNDKGGMHRSGPEDGPHRAGGLLPRLDRLAIGVEEGAARARISIPQHQHHNGNAPAAVQPRRESARGREQGRAHGC